MRALAAAARWNETATLPDANGLGAFLTGLPAQDITVLDRSQSAASGAKTLSASYSRPYLSHGSIGPSCAVAQFDNDTLTVWTHTQGVYPDRDAIAEMMGMPKNKVRCIHGEGAGCYGHNGADDAAADAALLARAMPGRPVRVQWTREQEHAWEPYGPAMLVKLDAELDDDGTFSIGIMRSGATRIRRGPDRPVRCSRRVTSTSHSPSRRRSQFRCRKAAAIVIPFPFISIPGARVIYHFLPTMPVRVSALRALGGYMNVFAIESFMDELAAAAGADPVAFRLKHLDDARAREVITTAAERFGWATKPRPAVPGRGQGFGFARYKNLAAYCAVACEVEVDRDSGRARMRRAVAAVDSGQVVNPDGIANQIEGAILQSMSWTLYEAVTFDERRITSVDWASYPILRFSAVPDEMEVHVINRPGMPFLGSGEAGQGPAAAAVANAIADATGHRFRDLPISAERVKAAIGV